MFLFFVLIVSITTYDAVFQIFQHVSDTWVLYFYAMVKMRYATSYSETFPLRRMQWRVQGPLGSVVRICKVRSLHKAAALGGPCCTGSECHLSGHGVGKPSIT